MVLFFSTSARGIDRARQITVLTTDNPSDSPSAFRCTG